MDNQAKIVHKLEEAIEEAKRFIRKAEIALDSKHLSGSDVAACKRASLDAYKALAAYRKAIREQYQHYY